MSDGQVTPVTERARKLLSIGAWNAVLREAAVHAGEQWIAACLPQRFRRGYAVSALGYALTNRKDPWARKDPGRYPETYDARKRAYMGHEDPLVWSGRLRAMIWQNARASARATKGRVRLEVGLGALSVGNDRKGYKQLPYGSVVRRTLFALPPAEVEGVRTQFVAYVAERMQAIQGPVKSAAKLPPPPPVLSGRSSELAAGRLSAARSAAAAGADIRSLAQQRILARKRRYAQWSSQAGGASPLGGRSRTPQERKAAHRLAARDSYRRRSVLINARRRQRSTLHAAIRRMLST